ncbi:unnamed protein product [Thelazia callipaeda]|uniref:PWWP domain-containing protein n=1 Tax=Thelazia callipaeda TaxID=103827 RepID=A0A0N5CXC2_THECL|nr:unnamed protein product [Thelazia callipaeda]
MAMTFCNNYNTTDVISDNNNSDSNNNNGNTIQAVISRGVETVRPSSCANVSVMIEGDLRWKTIIVPGGSTNSAATLPRPKRDFRFKRIEVKESPKWFVWPKRSKRNNRVKKEETVNDTEASAISSSCNCNSSFDKRTSEAAKIPQQPSVSSLTDGNTKFTMTNSNRNVSTTTQTVPSHTKVLQLVDAATNTLSLTNDDFGPLHTEKLISSHSDIKDKQKQGTDHSTLISSTLINTEVSSLSGSETKSCAVQFQAAISIGDEGRSKISDSTPATSQTFKILSISKKSMESGDDDDLELMNYVMLNCRQSQSQPIVLLTPSSSAKPTEVNSNTVKEVH